MRKGRRRNAEGRGAGNGRKAMSARRAQKERLHREHLESKRNITLDRRVVWEMRRTLEEQWERKKQAKLIAKQLRARQRAAEKREEHRAGEAQEERRHQAAKRRERQEETDRGEEDRKRRSGKERLGEWRGQHEEQTPAGKNMEGIQTRSTSRSTGGTPEGTSDVSIILASEREAYQRKGKYSHISRGC
eukprot:5443215-Pleurochrysis_carterae.AAC.1